MQTSYSIRRETMDDFNAIAGLQDAAFGSEHKIPDLVHDLRHQAGAFPTLSMVAHDKSGTIIGHVMLSHAWVDGPEHLIDVLVLSPIGVQPDKQGHGIGSDLIQASLQEADAIGAPLLFLEGNHHFYGPRGFLKAMDHGFRRPSLRIPENAFQVVKLSSFNERMTGTFVYRDVHWRHGVGL